MYKDAARRIFPPGSIFLLEMRQEFVIDKLHVRDNLLTNPHPPPKYHIFDKDETSAQNQSSEPGTGPMVRPKTIRFLIGISHNGKNSGCRR
jgi:hypothetical protein